MCIRDRAKVVTNKCIDIIREVLLREGAPADIIQGIQQPSIALTQELMKRCDLVIATGGRPMVKSAYSSGTPAYGSGAGNATVIIDNTADTPERQREAAQNLSLIHIFFGQPSDHCRGCGHLAGRGPGNHRHPKRLYGTERAFRPGAADRCEARRTGHGGGIERHGRPCLLYTSSNRPHRERETRTPFGAAPIPLSSPRWCWPFWWQSMSLSPPSPPT